MFDPLTATRFKKDVLREALEKESALELIRLPEETAGRLNADPSFIVREDRDQFDYVYRTGDLAELPGQAFDAKRNFVRRFRDQFSFEFLPLTKDHIRDCLYFEEEWCQAKDCQSTDSLGKERQAVREMLEHLGALGVTGAMIRIAGKIEAVTLGEALNPRTFVIHIEKANGVFIGIYQAINQMFSQQVKSMGFDFINREQDLGVPGLRKAKESYHPVLLVKKYSAILRQ